jgi:FtsP/CotA-like multicopper oxidase with cupredoxin domain
MEFSRRDFLIFAGAAASGLLLRDPSHANALDLVQQLAQSSPATKLQATKRTIAIDGKSATVMGILQPDGKQGMEAIVNSPFRVVLENKLTVPTAIHWHGLHPPNNQDGVPGVTQPVIRPDASSLYDFPLIPGGTHWMHSHQGLQEAYLLSAPLIVHEKADQSADEQQVIIFLGDFTFTSPKEVYAELRAGNKTMAGVSNRKSEMNSKMASPAMTMSKPDANDVNYDAYLANDRTLNDPDVVRVERSGRLRLRIINGSSGTNYFIDLGALSGELIATDGMAVKPLRASRFPLAIAQRIDVRVQLPPSAGAFPILAFREAAPEQTGIILASAGASIQKLPVKAAPAGFLTLGQERQMSAVSPLSVKAPDQTFELRLQGNMAKYDWMINDVIFDVNNPGKEKAPIRVKSGQRIALKFVNETPMSHPMHLHGHAFQVTEINGQPLQGAVRDTILVPGNQQVTVAFNANNPGLWFVHCHILWHLEAGMATLVEYAA